MDVKKTPAAVEEFLFGRGQNWSDYVIEESPGAAHLWYQSAEGGKVDLPMHDTEFAAAVTSRLKELGVQVVRRA